MHLDPFDLQRIVKTLPSDIVKLLKESGGRVFLAGGFIRASIAGEKINDIDLWGSSKHHLGLLADALTSKRNGQGHKTICMRTENAYTVLTQGRTPVQFITRWVFEEPEHCAESFDFSIASAAVWWNPTLEWREGPYPRVGGWDSYCADSFYRDLASKSLVYMSPARNEDAGGSFMRLQKFMHKGYSISPGNLAKVVARLVSKVRFRESDSEEHTSQVILGLLREVDPLVVVDGVELRDEQATADDQGDDEPSQSGGVPGVAPDWGSPPATAPVSVPTGQFAVPPPPVAYPDPPSPWPPAALSPADPSDD
jgi:hypothetical protein